MENILEKLFGAPCIKDFNIGGQKLKLRVLTKPEQLAVTKEVTNAGYSVQVEGGKIPTSDLIAYTDASKVPTLARAIVSINETPFSVLLEAKSEEVVEKAEQYLNTFPSPQIDVLYDLYLELVTEYDQKLGELKKGSLAQKVEQSGKSVKSSKEPQTS